MRWTATKRPLILPCGITVSHTDTHRHTDVLKNTALRLEMYADRRRERDKFHNAHSSVCRCSSASLLYATECSIKLVLHYVTQANGLTCKRDTTHWRDSVLIRVLNRNFCTLTVMVAYTNQ